MYRASLTMGVSSIRWEPLFRLNTCEDKYFYYQTIINSLMEHCFPVKTLTRHTADKPWITDLFRTLCYMFRLLKAKILEISSDTYQLQFIKLHHFKLERFNSIEFLGINLTNFRLNSQCNRRLTWSAKRADSTNQKRFPVNARA